MTSDRREQGRILGGSPHDESIGRILERTEAIALQHEDFRRVLEGLNGTLSALRETIVRLDTTLQFVTERNDEHGAKIADFDSVKGRLVACESELKKWSDVRGQAVKYAIFVALLAITSGMAGAPLLRTALGLH